MLNSDQVIISMTIFSQFAILNLYALPFILFILLTCAIVVLQAMTAPRPTVLVIRAVVGVASVTSPQTPHDVPAVTLDGTARVALTRA